ncbi:ARM repeat-containing protein [Suhomyces tanzawaensis NRRL Y-17324]|uniref:Pumilio homology domain family member 3 n=1 Tax=Suhomyces tanzawaensis NRRL Y-17324 TaxID=984487 RepID=A0A1E4SBY4_9ASCO|nr:ARM repeat-containing protein [Suhomyces tanzawaensis NRRL Y-17324]ODV76976.1 ARM repeat-containing protein [Suhomyces tanzawaensis NRRL Y-17324]
MPSETIWSNNGGSPIQSNSGSSAQYRSVLDQVDPEVAKLLGNNPSQLTSERRFSFNDGSDIDGNLFGLKRGSLSAITAPVGGASSVNYNVNQNSSNNNRLNFGTASISGGIASRHPPQDSFLQKFSSVADATREIELSNGLSNISLDNPGSRRTSFNNDGIKPLDFNLLGSPRGSLNENLNMPAPRTSRHQSISEKIDHYNNTSPIQASAALSIASDSLQSDHKGSRISHQTNAPQNFWNPATAASFTPAFSYGYLGDNSFPGGVPVPPPPPPQQAQQPFNHYNRGPKSNNIPPISPPAFIIPSPPPQFIDPSIYGMMGYGVSGIDEEKQLDEAIEKNEDVQLDEEGRPKEGSRNVHTPGIGMMNRQAPPASFMFHPFSPYPMYQQGPPMGMPHSPVQQPLDGNVKHFDAPVAGNPPPPPPPPPAPTTGTGGKRKGGSRNNHNENGGKGGNHIYRSPLLEEVRSNSKGKEYYLKDIYGHAIEFTKDQHGSRFIQQKLPDASEEEKEVIFNEIRDISYELMTDVFGNYVIQKYFEHGSNTQRNVLLENMLGHIYELSLQMYGCRVIQRAIEEITLDGQIKIIEELRDHILICAKDQNGNHVIQKSIERIPFDRIKFVLESLNNQIYHLSTHPYGCRVIQRLLDYSNIEDQEKILKELNRFIFYLIQDQYGNYVMQHILERGKMRDREEILKVVLGSVVTFSKHKFASNVIEKCIKFGTIDQRRRILHEVMLGNEDFNVELVSDDSPLALMMKDQYANYVIQKLVEGFDAKSDEKRRLVVKLRQYLKQISSKNTYGKHLASVEKMIIVAETALIEAENN